MEARPGDSAPEKPVKGPVPLKSVTFTRQVPVPGFKEMASHVEVGVFRTDDGRAKAFPQPFLDMGLRTIIIEGRHYPLEMVVCFERARTAATKTPTPPALPDYTIGKRVEKTNESPPKTTKG